MNAKRLTVQRVMMTLVLLVSALLRTSQIASSSWKQITQHARYALCFRYLLISIVILMSF